MAKEQPRSEETVSPGSFVVQASAKSTAMSNKVAAAIIVDEGIMIQMLK
jgi:hypothetical protein